MNETQIEIYSQMFYYCLNCNFLSSTPHLHNKIELIYVIKGKAVCHVDNRSYEISDKEFFISFPNQIHYYTDCIEGEYCVFIFSTDLLFDMQSVFHDNLPTDNIFKYNERCSSLINDFMDDKNIYYENIRIGILNILIPLLLSQSTLTKKIKADTPTIEKILTYCNQNFTKDISLENISNELYISKDHISFLFNKKLNIQFKQYINSLKINKACELMRKCEKNLSYISEEVGFGSIRSFNRVFKQIMEITPLQYYKQINNKKNNKKN